MRAIGLLIVRNAANPVCHNAENVNVGGARGLPISGKQRWCTFSLVLRVKKAE